MSPDSPRPKVEQWQVDGEYAGQRLDNYLLARLKGVPKTRIYRMIRTGEVRVNGGRIASDYRVAEGDVLRIPPVRVPQRPEASTAGRGASLAMASNIADRIQVVLEDSVLLAINKPAGLAVHGGSGVKLGVIEALRLARGLTAQDPQASGGDFLELVHRLDRETSGLMLLAKRRSCLTELHRQLREGEMRKRYLAIVWGDWPKALVRIDAALHKWVNAKGERWVRVQEDGQSAITNIRVIKRFEHPLAGPLTVLVCEPLTGRTHQLRVHLASAGHPIVGDPKYGLHERDAAFGPKHAEPAGRLATRMMLHAWQLRLTHPKEGQTLQLHADPDALLADALTQVNVDLEDISARKPLKESR
jgi:23S rRNA pseudouridine955/2504/2580 synthase